MKEIVDKVLTRNSERMYESLVCFIDKLKDDPIGEVIVDTENDGTLEHPIQMPYVEYSKTVIQFEKAVYAFQEDHPEYELNQYISILEKHNIQWEIKSMSNADVSNIDGQGIMALLMGAVRAERFSEGALRKFFLNGSIEKWLYRLKEIEEEQASKSENIKISVQDDMKALKDFMLDIECLDPLSEWTNHFNLFDILKITRTEIRHSNMLSWLLNPNENHGLGDSVIRGFVQYVVSSFSEDEDIFDTLLMDFHDFMIQREWHSIDVLAVSVNEKFVLCIENKIDSKEHDNQLNRYRKIVEDTYPEYKKMYIYLSPEGIEASDPEYWCSMSYQDVLDIVENARMKAKLLPDVALLIDNYIETIRRDIVGDEKLAKICAEIYAKHQKALDLIYENRPDKASDLATIIKTWAIEKTKKSEIEIVEEKCSKSYIHFKTSYMSSIMPDSKEPDSGWNTKNHYFYEIRNIEGREFYIQLVFSSRNMTDEQREICDKVNKHFPSKQQKENWQWRSCFVSKHSKVDEELIEEKIYDQLNKKLEEIKVFEEKLKEIFVE